MFFELLDRLRRDELHARSFLVAICCFVTERLSYRDYRFAFRIPDTHVRSSTVNVYHLLYEIVGRENDARTNVF
jgi:hypothetical protein